MKQPIVRFPVVCPRCGVESLAEVSIDLAAEALMRNEGTQLKATCHNLYWTASPTEMQQLREYMSAVFVDGAADLEPGRRSRQNPQQQMRR